MEGFSEPNRKWVKSVLVIVNTRLGLKSVDPSHLKSLKTSISMPQSVGMMGGSKHRAYYFVGFQGNEFIMLDPHFVQDSLDPHGDYSLHEHEFRCRDASMVPGSALDPCVSLGFFIRNF